ncbi:HD-GYP domain-containing protein [Oceanobacillus piezotolerans]|uniref:HD-GYP domain-containing protein n=1 Tax=Oceanobacillus piezotolerans TaxID=2448030 RepID=A0A498D5I7_9BACI|nr:HD-GYP domain-containing protein [Oceanobacillus piezotolerans]RLL41725.1 HD-GYP domain-containing protein [Oceanobacillus piezotolerans]
MRVKPSQLVPGSVLLKEVKGKTSKPIIPVHTVLTEEHIEVLQLFLVDYVDVSTKLKNGEQFKPKEPGKIIRTPVEKQQQKAKKLSFEAHFHQAVKEYKSLFISWQNGLQIDIHKVREFIIPLLRRTEDIDKSVYLLHHYTSKEEYIFSHSVAVSILASYLGRKLRLSQGEWIQLGLAGLLSDAGMAKIDSNIVFKQGSLTEKEREQIINHPTYSYRMVENTPSITQGVKLAILQHHERSDGSGYPLGIRKDKTHIFARILAVADTYHAMTSERLYKEKQSPFKVIEEIKNNRFTKYDTKIVHTFIQSLANFSVGTRVMLSNEAIGEIVFIEPKELTRPMVRLNESGEIISLKDEPKLHIQEIISY